MLGNCNLKATRLAIKQAMAVAKEKGISISRALKISAEQQAVPKTFSEAVTKFQRSGLTITEAFVEAAKQYPDLHKTHLARIGR